MGKLFNLKEWLTVADAAKHLSIVFGEDVTEADVLRLALDRRLRLSVHFVNHAKARCGKVVTWDQTNWWLLPGLDLHPGWGATKIGEQATTDECRPCPQKLETIFNEIPEAERGNYYPMMQDLNIDGERFLSLSDEVTTLRGVWDLPMIGNERLDIEHEYQNLTGGPAVTLSCLDGAFVEGRDGQMCQLQEHFDENEYQPGSKAKLQKLKRRFVEMMALDPTDEGTAEAEALLSQHEEDREKFLEQQETRPAKEKYYPAGGLPKDAVIVVRTEALREFEQRVNGNQNGTGKQINCFQSSSRSAYETASDCEEGNQLEIKGALYSSLQRAIRAFPIQFPGYKEDMPMAKVVKGWIKDAGIEKTDRPAQVLATMVIENFSSDS